MEPLFLEPTFKEKIWGGTQLRDKYDYDIPSDHTGECWAISAHPHGQSVVKNGVFKGKKLDEVYNTHRELFGDSQQKTFPLLTKILDASDDLSVQVHPNDAYAKKHEGELGKTECWYILDAKPGAKIIYGHHAKNHAELEQMVEQHAWKDLLNEVEVHPGDFFYVPSGTIHGIGKGTLILETQQSSDTTYRVYDYDRKDAEGHTRPLHLTDALNVITAPQHMPELQIKEVRIKKNSIVTLAKTDFFNVYKWEVNGILSLEATAPYTLVSVIDGAGDLTVDEDYYPLQKGDHFILPTPIQNWTISGKLTCIASTPGTKNTR